MAVHSPSYANGSESMSCRHAANRAMSWAYVGSTKPYVAQPAVGVTQGPARMWNPCGNDRHTRRTAGYPQPMRETFHKELTELRDLLREMCTRAGTAIRAATAALLAADREEAERVLAADADLDAMRDQCEDRAQQMLALQAPVASDLRIVLAAIYCAEKIERMGDLASHVANTTRHSHPNPVVPDELRPTFTKLGDVCANMAERLVCQIADPKPGAFAELDEVDHEVDTLHAEVLRKITDPTWPHDVPLAINLTLVTRFYERYADQAVSAAKRIEFVRTGEIPDHRG